MGYRRIEGDELKAVLAQHQAAERAVIARAVVAEHFGKQASDVRYLRITFASSYNDEGGNDPSYSVVGLGDVDPASVPESKCHEDSDYNGVILPESWIDESKLLTSMGLEYYGGDALFAGDEDRHELITIDLRADVEAPGLYVYDPEYNPSPVV